MVLIRPTKKNILKKLGFSSVPVLYKEMKELFTYKQSGKIVGVDVLDKNIAQLLQDGKIEEKKINNEHAYMLVKKS